MNVAITIDCGGSEGRVLNCGNKDNNGLVAVPNEFYHIPKNNFRKKDVINPASVINIQTSPDGRYNGYYGTGVSARPYDGVLMSMDSTQFKTKTKEFYNQFVYMVAQGVLNTIYCQQRGLDRFEEVKDYSILEKSPMWNFIDVIIGTNIPIKEHSGREDMTGELKKALAGHYTVEFPLLPTKPVFMFQIQEKYIGVMPEGGVCITALGSAIAADDYTLVVDLGHVSDDIAVYYGKQLTTMDSFSRAGSTLLADLESALADSGFRGNSATTIKALTTGKMANGTAEVDVTSIIQDVQRDFVNSVIKQDIIKILNRAGIVPAQVKNFVPIGNGMQIAAHGINMPASICSALRMDNVIVHMVDEDLRYANLRAVDKFTTILEKMYIKERGSL